MTRQDISPPPAGVLCSVCWGLDKPFGSGPTPSVVTVVFSGIEMGDKWEPADGKPPSNQYQLAQTLPCTFTFSNADFDIELVYDSSSTTLTYDAPGFPIFNGQESGSCHLELENDLLFEDNHFFGGQAEIVL